MVTTPATQTNRDPNRDKTLATSNNPPKLFDCSGGLAAFRFFLSREHRELIDVKTISLGTSSTVSTVWSVCVCVFSSHSFWTSSSLDVPAGVTQEEGHTGFLIHFLSAVRALIVLAKKIQPFLSLVDREVEFCVLTI